MEENKPNCVYFTREDLLTCAYDLTEIAGFCVRPSGLEMYFKSGYTTFASMSADMAQEVCRQWLESRGVKTNGRK
jgi:hypothetical protein